MGEHISTAEAAKIIGIAPRTLSIRWRTLKQGPTYYKVNHSVGYYDLDEVTEFAKTYVNLGKTKVENASEFNWDWATPEALKSLKAACYTHCGRNCPSLKDADDMFQYACLFVAASPNYFQRKSTGKFLWNLAVNRALKHVSVTNGWKYESLMNDGYWRLTA